MVGHDVFDNGQAQSSSTGLAGAGLIHAEEALKYALLVFRGDAYATVGDTDENYVSTDHLLGNRYRHLIWRVMDSVGNEVRNSGNQQGFITHHLYTDGFAAGELVFVCVGSQLVARHGLVDDLIEVNRLHLREGFRALQLGQRDELVDHIRHSGSFLLNLAAEVLDVFGVPGVLQEGLGQQRNAADGRLELMGHVCHKVAASGFHADRFGLVGAVDDDEAVVVKRQRFDHCTHLGDAVAGAALGDGQIQSAGLLILEDLLRHGPNIRVHGAIVDHRHLVRRRVGKDDLFGAREHRHTGRRSAHRQVEDLAHAGDLVGVSVAGAAALQSFADTPKNRYGKATGRHSG